MPMEFLYINRKWYQYLLHIDKKVSRKLLNSPWQFSCKIVWVILYCEKYQVCDNMLGYIWECPFQKKINKRIMPQCEIIHVLMQISRKRNKAKRLFYNCQIHVLGIVHK